MAQDHATATRRPRDQRLQDNDRPNRYIWQRIASLRPRLEINVRPK